MPVQGHLRYQSFCHPLCLRKQGCYAAPNKNQERTEFEMFVTLDLKKKHSFFFLKQFIP